MSRIVRAAMTETRNAYPRMPVDVSELHGMWNKLEEIRKANVDHHVGLIREAAARDVSVICLGELFAFPYFPLEKMPMWKNVAEDAGDGPTVTAMREAAREASIIVVAPIYEHDAAANGRFNAAVIIDERGEIIGKYRKTHIPEGSNELARVNERYYYEPSDGQLGEWPCNVSANSFFPVFQTSVVRLGIAICYDRHFPEVMRTLSHQGAELVVCPSVTFGAKAREMWALEFPVDAARHNLFIGGSNRRGKEEPWDVEYFGESYFVGPNGRLPRLEAPPELVIADLDLGEMGRPDPSGWRLLEHRRPEIYE